MVSVRRSSCSDLVNLVVDDALQIVPVLVEGHSLARQRSSHVMTQLMHAKEIVRHRWRAINMYRVAVSTRQQMEQERTEKDASNIP